MNAQTSLPGGTWQTKSAITLILRLIVILILEK
jgi:hypothetical protein